MKLVRLLVLALAFLCGHPAVAREAAITVAVGSVTRHFTTSQLLGRSDAATLTVSQDPSYGRTMVYRSVPLRALLSVGGRNAPDTIEIRSTDGFVAQLPTALILTKADPWIAIEDPAHRWPLLPTKSVSAGPFYLIWHHPEQATVSPEQWPYAIATLIAVTSPAQRWPAIAVARSVPAGSPARRGQAVFAANCLACHRLDASGEGTMGPDLLRPVRATFYLTGAGLRALIRNPAALRTWPQQHMPAFPAKVLANADIEAIVSYLRYLGSRPISARGHGVQN